MFVEILLFVLLGILAGTLTGLIPGFHINLISVLIVGFSAHLLGIVSIPALGVFIIAMAITHTFLDVLPAIFLGAPDSDTALGVLPGHRLLLKGQGFEAIKLTVIGSLLSLILALLLFPLFILLVPTVYGAIQPFIAYLLIGVIVFMILLERKIEQKAWSTLVFFLSGILGLIALTTPNIKQPLFPMLSGLFGTSMLTVSLMKKVVIPKQTISESITLKFWDKTKAITVGTFSGSFVSFFPGLGPAQAAIIGNVFAGNLATYAFLILIGSINTVNMAVSLVSLYTIEKARNGAVLAIHELFGSIDFSILLLFLATALFAAGIATFLAMYLTRVFIKLIEKVNYVALCVTVLLSIVILTYFISSWMGLAILFVATAIGIIPNIIDVKRSHLMGCLILPIILFFLL